MDHCPSQANVYFSVYVLDKKRNKKKKH